MKHCLIALIAVLFTAPVMAATPDAGSLRAGAARVDYTPPADQLPRNIIGILDHVYVRALVLDNGKSRAAMVDVDAGGLSSDLFQDRKTHV